MPEPMRFSEISPITPRPLLRRVFASAGRLGLGAGLLLVLPLALSPAPSLRAAGAAPPAISLELLAEGLRAPLLLAAPDDGSGRRFVVDQIGLVHEISPRGAVMPQPPAACGPFTGSRR